MKKIVIFFLILFTFLLFQNNTLVQSTVIQSCELFITKLFPSLFPMMILSDLFLYFDLPNYICKYLGPIFSKFFSTSFNGAFAFLISCISGTPTNSYIIKNLYFQNHLTEKEASHLLSFAFFTNPLFYYTMLKFIFPNQTFTIIKLLLIPYFCNILIGIFSKTKDNSFSNLVTNEKTSFGIMLSNSIKNAMNTLSLILGTVTLFLILNAFINPMNIPLLSGLLEVSQGLNSLIDVSYSQKIKELLTIFFVSFGGLSIHLQIKGILSDTSISYWQFFKGRMKQCILGILLILFF